MKGKSIRQHIARLGAMPIQHRLRQWRALPKPHDRAKALNSMPAAHRAHMYGQALTDTLNASVLSDQPSSLPGQDTPTAEAENMTGDQLNPLSSGETAV